MRVILYICSLDMFFGVLRFTVCSSVPLVRRLYLSFGVCTVLQVVLQCTLLCISIGTTVTFIMDSSILRQGRKKSGHANLLCAHRLGLGLGDKLCLAVSACFFLLRVCSAFEPG